MSEQFSNKNHSKGSKMAQIKVFFFFISSKITLNGNEGKESQSTLISERKDYVELLLS
jgi:hypothetical protein